MHKDTSCQKICAQCGSVFYRDKRSTWSYWAKAKFCSRTCSAKYGAKIKIDKNPTLSHAFWKNVERRDDLQCWKWLGYFDKDGYPLLSFRGKLMRAGRVALIVSGAEVTQGQHACHSCGNHWCCNPSHIYAGTPKENNSDKKRHGTHKQGEDVYCSKLTKDQVMAIRASNLSDKQAARIHGVTASNIAHIRSRKTWKHLP